MYLFKMISCVRFLADTYMQFQDTWIILNTYLQLSPSLRKNMYVFGVFVVQVFPHLH